MSDKTSIDYLFQPVQNLLIGTKEQGISGQKNIMEEKNTKIKQCIDKCIQLETQHNLEEYKQFKSEVERIIMVETFVTNQRFRQFDACDQILQGLEMNFNSKMKNLKKKANTQKKMN